MGQPCKFSFHVAVVAAAIFYIYLSTVFVFIDRWFGLGSSPGMLNAAVFTFIALVSISSYRRAIYTDPGRVPSSFVPDVEDPDSPIHEIKRKVCHSSVSQIILHVFMRHFPHDFVALEEFGSFKWRLSLPDIAVDQEAGGGAVDSRHGRSRAGEDCALQSLQLAPAVAETPRGGDLRYCQKCSHYKPPRAHHCRICNRCVLRMDHHCIWMNNCVGHGNYKIFFVFVFYAVLACIYSLVLLVGSATVDSHQDAEDSSRIIHVITSKFTVGALVFGARIFPRVALLSYFPKQDYNRGVRAMWLAEKGGQIYSHPYDIGTFENLTAVSALSVSCLLLQDLLILGPKVLCWLCPSSGHIGSGLRFKTKYDALMGLSTPD
ncbi:hypothetical protein SASPL_102071 [Salvia splendens]|uniref:S-acyltransferase n=1 Tax=Salvia splendens TaxID=180675 RepID=A0A8X8YQJ1_SALSN|nr:hypothetical protein SASPL_102071 [Salvia splendens]